jgi:hypothetical protein
MNDKYSNIQKKEKPGICAIDLDLDIIEAIHSKGLHCFPGTLGSQVKIPNSNRSHQHFCLLHYVFPANIHEYDIVIIDLKAREAVEYIKSEHQHSYSKGSEQTYLLSRYPETIFDPRPLAISILRSELRDFFAKETIVIIFCSEDERCEYYPMTLTHNGNYVDEPIEHSLYEIIPSLQKIYNKNGNNTIASDITGEMKNLLQKYNDDFIYEAVFQHPTIWLQAERTHVEISDFLPLLLNASDEIVGFMDSSCSPTTIFAFPQIKSDRKKEFILELIEEILPSLFPTIFPNSEKFSWLSQANYPLPNQKKLLEKKLILETKYQKSLIKIEKEIKDNKSKYQFLHDLIVETGDLLVKSIENYLLWLGYEGVINVDETHPDIKEEDIQIPLENGLLVIEIKGIGGTSKDSECSQINKIKYRRSKERNNFDVLALYIVNHQRYIPPIERRNPPFSTHQIADAYSEERGLLTTYDLFKLYSNIEEGFITKEDARKSLLKYGLVEFNPSKSIPIGQPDEVLYHGQIVIINITNTAIAEGSILIVCNENIWFKAEILEIQLNGQKSKFVSDGEIGLKLSHSVLKTSNLWLLDTSSQLT